MTTSSSTAAATSPRSLNDLPLPHPGTPDLRSGDRLLVWLAVKQRWVLLSGIAWGIAWMGLQAAVPAALGAGVQATTERDTSRVLMLAILVLALGIGQAIAGVMRHRKAVVNWISAASRIQQLVARSAADLGADLSRQVSTGEVVAVTASDVERIGSTFDVMARFAGSIIAFIGVGIVLICTSRPLGLLVLIGLPLLSLVILPLLRPLERRESVQRGAAGQASSIAADTIGGLRVLRGIGGEQLFVARYESASQEVRRAAVSTARVRSVLDALQVLLPGIFVVLVTWLGARLALDDQLTVGELVAFYGYTAFLVLPLRTITEAADKFTRGRVAARRVVSLMSLQRDESGRAAAARANNAGLRSLPEAISLIDTKSGIAIPAGGVTAIVCGDASTASDLANRLAGYGVQPPGVFLNGIAYEQISLDDIRRIVVLQDKDPVILSGTLIELLVVPGSDQTLLARATSAACADDVVDGLGGDPASVEHGFNVTVPERGRTLSGGQRQRLSLDRSLMSRAPVLILDEPTSAVDAHTEARMAERLRNYRSGQTTVVFTTSPLVLDQCDHVVFAPNGLVAATGQHSDLVRMNAEYRAIVIRGDD